MFFFRHPKRVTDTREVAVLVQESTTPAADVARVLVAKKPAGIASDGDMEVGQAGSPPANAESR